MHFFIRKRLLRRTTMKKIQIMILMKVSILFYLFCHLSSHPSYGVGWGDVKPLNSSLTFLKFFLTAFGLDNETHNNFV